MVILYIYSKNEDEQLHTTAVTVSSDFTVPNRPASIHGATAVTEPPSVGLLAVAVIFVDETGTAARQALEPLENMGK